MLDNRNLLISDYVKVCVKGKPLEFSKWTLFSDHFRSKGTYVDISNVMCFFLNWTKRQIVATLSPQKGFVFAIESSDDVLSLYYIYI